MPVTDFNFQNRIFFAVESGVISGDDAKDWAKRLVECTQTSEGAVVALVDARTVTSVTRPAERIFIQASHTDNLLAVVVATNPIVSLQATTIGILGQRGYTRVFLTYEEAQQHAESLVKQYQKRM